MYKLFSAIDVLIEQRLQFPALMLVFSGIDAIAWLGSPATPKATVRDRFTGWVDRYLLPAKPLGCTAIDLYAARCGLLHTLTSDSDLTDQGRATRLAYAWGSADPTVLQAAIDSVNPGGAIAVKIEDVALGFRLGTGAMFEAAKSDARLDRVIRSRAPAFFADLPSDVTQWRTKSEESRD